MGGKMPTGLVGLIPSYLFVDLYERSKRLVNPFALELGVEAYVQADILPGNAAKNSCRPQELRRMWDDGVAVRTGTQSN
jgi:hypothetical protein